MSKLVERLRKQIVELKLELLIEKRNHAFYKESGEMFEEALGPHHIHSNGCWIERARDCRIERDFLRKKLKIKQPKVTTKCGIAYPFGNPTLDEAKKNLLKG